MDNNDRKNTCNTDAVSVIMSIYNEPLNYVSQSIKSIANQDYDNLQIIIIILPKAGVRILKAGIHK